jgi:TM2 domain-containing membrane protein YozV
MTNTAPKAIKTKLIFCWTALLFGFFGGHWLYMKNNKKFFWYVLFTPLCAFAGWLDCLRYGLMPDEKFNAIFNPQAPTDTKQTTGLVVAAIALSLGVSMIALMSLLAILFQMPYTNGLIS